MISKIKLVIILEGCFNYGVLLLSLMKAFEDPSLESMKEVNQPKSIRNEGQLDDELDVKQLLRKEVVAE